MAYKGKFTPKNPGKYVGNNLTNIVWRSTWERKFMQYCDSNPAIIRWNSEGIVIPYISPVDGRRHRYFVDFWIEMKDASGDIVQKLIEIKPHSQCKPPRKKSRVTKRYIEECKTYAINQAKWEAATIAAKKNGMEFVVLDEYSLGIKARKK
jgi:hypothetical protein